MLLTVAAAWLGQAAVFSTPNLSRPAHLLILGLLLGATAVGGYVAARLADTAPLLHGLLVAVTGILAVAVSNPGFVPVPRPLVVTQALSLLAGPLGAMVARLTTPRRT